MLKKCTKCGKTRPLEEFHNRAASTDGKQDWCKECVLGHPIPSNDGKICTKCKAFKPFSKFNKSSSSSDGHQSYCKDCKAEYQKARSALQEAGIISKKPQQEKQKDRVQLVVDLLSRIAFPNAQKTSFTSSHLILKYSDSTDMIKDMPFLINSGLAVTLSGETILISI